MNITDEIIKGFIITVLGLFSTILIAGIVFLINILKEKWNRKKNVKNLLIFFIIELKSNITMNPHDLKHINFNLFESYFLDILNNKEILREYTKLQVIYRQWLNHRFFLEINSNKKGTLKIINTAKEELENIMLNIKN